MTVKCEGSWGWYILRREHCWISGRCPYQSNYYHPDDKQWTKRKRQFQTTKYHLTLIRSNMLSQVSVAHMWAQQFKFKLRRKISTRHNVTCVRLFTPTQKLTAACSQMANHMTTVSLHVTPIAVYLGINVLKQYDEPVAVEWSNHSRDDYDRTWRFARLSYAWSSWTVP